ncbi:MAG TPA: hypothetical protein VGU66_04230 [Candidatus Elarobacter sp.]|nr:hypothetical protein [Candidatus Elarobacter sp.]
MFELDAASRALLAAAAFTAFGTAFVTTPIVARSDAVAVVEPARTSASLAPRTVFADVVPRRDPFAGGDAPARASMSPPQAQIAVAANPPLPQIPAALRPLPPNAGVGDGTFPFASGTRIAAAVTAVITGPHPFALVDEAGTTRVLTVGDRIGGDAIVAIGADGVRLSGGTVLAVARASETAHPIPGGP